MFTLKRFAGAALAAGLVAQALVPADAHAQLVQPGFRIRPTTDLNTAAFNQALTGSIYPGVAPITSFPYGNPLFNPAANPLVNPLINPYINPGMNPSALLNYYRPQVANPFYPYTNLGLPNTNPYLYGTTPGLGNPYAASNPYTPATPYAAASPYATFSNPYAAATLSTYPYTGATLSTSPYGGYGDSGSSYPSYPYYGYGETPAAGYLRGTAEMITAQGRWLKDFQQAALIKEQGRQAMIDTRKKRFDEWLYERQHTPTPEEERQRDVAMQLQRALNSPPTAEVLSGQALNTIVSDIAKMDDKKLSSMPAIPLDEDVLRHLNVTSGGSGNPGLLKNEGRVSWPLALKSEDFKRERELLDSLAPDAVRQALGGRVDAGVLRDMNNALASMKAKLANSIRELTPNQYIEASRFLGQFQAAADLLARPNAGDYFARGFAGKAITVQDLVKYLTSHGMTFAPAVAGDEGAYMALYQAVAAFAAAAKSQLTADRPAGSGGTP